MKNANGKCLSAVKFDSPDSNHTINQWDCGQSGYDQLWSWNETISGSKNRHLCNANKKCVASWFNLKQNIVLLEWEHSEENSQRFTFFNVDTNGYSMIKNDYGKCLGIEKKSKANVESSAWALDCNSSDSGQRWKWQPHNSGKWQ